MRRWPPPVPPRGVLLRTVGFAAVFGGGSLVVAMATLPRGPLVVIASVMAYQWVVALLYILWRWDDRPRTAWSSGAFFRNLVFVTALIFGGTLLLYNWPGGEPVNFVAAAAYACMVTALRVAVWGWRD